MKLRVFNALLFGSLAVWMLFTHPWVAPGFALLAASQLMVPIAVWRHAKGRAAWASIVLFLGLGYLGLACLFALMVGEPTTAGFWLVFGTVATILGPALWLFQRITLGKAVGG
jgi:predicted membrane channel-forming protein YqfA (hemolysin III family)